MTGVRARRALGAAGSSLLALLVALVALVVALLAGCSGPGDASVAPASAVSRSAVAAPTVPASAPAPVPSVDLASLPVADPWAVLPQAPADPDPHGTLSGEVATVSDASGAPLFDAPGGTAFARLPQEAYSGVTGYPVIAHDGAWVQVLTVARRGLPSQVGATGVNGATGWVPTGDVWLSTLDDLIVADLGAGTLTLQRGGAVVATVRTGYGTPATPTPTDRGFVMAVAANPQATYSKVFVYLSTHSPALDAFDGGPAQTAIHAYASHSGAISNGCLRIAASDLDTFASVPLGTPVLVRG